MKYIRDILVWLMVMSLPLEGMASIGMSHCQDLQTEQAASAASSPSSHDHANMLPMVSMSDADSMAHSHHAVRLESNDPAKRPGVFKADCSCGCDCSSNCAATSAGMMLPLSEVSLLFATDGSRSVAMPQGRAHAAYRYQPLRPPSAVAL